jgi:hypothetical protein
MRVGVLLRGSCLELLKVPSADGTMCMACDNSTGATLDMDAADCTCPADSFALIERDATGVRLPGGKQCVQCPASSYRDPLVSPPSSPLPPSCEEWSCQFSPTAGEVPP